MREHLLRAENKLGKSLNGALRPTRHSHNPYAPRPWETEGLPTEEPSQVSVGEDAGHVVIVVGEGTLVFSAEEAKQLGEEIVRIASICLKRR
jgi:hypothetical protein